MFAHSCVFKLIALVRKLLAWNKRCAHGMLQNYCQEPFNWRRNIQRRILLTQHGDVWTKYSFWETYFYKFHNWFLYYSGVLFIVLLWFHKIILILLWWINIFSRLTFFITICSMGLNNFGYPERANARAKIRT